MHRLSQLSDDERKRIVADFVDQAFAGLDIEPGFAARMRSATPELPDDPTPGQVDAWIELAELVQDDDFRATIRRMSERHAADRVTSEASGAGRTAGAVGSGRAEGRPAGAVGSGRAEGRPAGAVGSGRAEGRPAGPDWQAAAALVVEHCEPARAAGLDPGGPEAARVLDRVVPAFAGLGDDPSDRAWRAELADRVAGGTDARAERYWQLLATINGWPPVPTTVPAWEWFVAALRAG